MEDRGVENQAIHLPSLPKSKSVDITSNKILEKRLLLSQLVVRVSPNH